MGRLIAIETQLDLVHASRKTDLFQLGFGLHQDCSFSLVLLQREYLNPARGGRFVFFYFLQMILSCWRQQVAILQLWLETRTSTSEQDCGFQLEESSLCRCPWFKTPITFSKSHNIFKDDPLWLGLKEEQMIWTLDWSVTVKTERWQKSKLCLLVDPCSYLTYGTFGNDLRMPKYAGLSLRGTWSRVAALHMERSQLKFIWLHVFWPLL